MKRHRRFSLAALVAVAAFFLLAGSATPRGGAASDNAAPASWKAKGAP